MMLILFIIHMILSFPLLSFSTPPYSLTKGSSLSVEKPDDVLIHQLSGREKQNLDCRGKLFLNHAGSMVSADPTVYVLMFPMRNLVGDALAYQGTRSKMIVTGLSDVNQISVPLAMIDQVSFLQLPHVEFYGYDIKFHSNHTLKNCKNTCLKQCKCYGFQYKFDKVHGFYNCFTKSLLFNGYLSSHFLDSMYIKLPKASLSSYTMPIQEFELNCSRLVSLQLDRTYKKPKENGTSQFIVWFATAIGGVETICFVLCFLFKTRQDSNAIAESYFQVATGFRKFTYIELKKATRNLAEEIGQGGGGVVHKGVLSDRQIAAIKLLNEANQGGEEFLAEPQNILLDSNYLPKVADFGLSKLCKRGSGHGSNFSRIRGTRGYMAPEWISYLQITTKVDVYSYGVVVLEMVTGKSPMTSPCTSGNSREMEQKGTS
ncbi:hypothetical protein ACSBR1_000579 [Camellia fascicularis]